jgi:Tol biopolymer transport system component
MMNPNGTEIRQIASDEYWHSDGKWSPDAKRIACYSDEGIHTHDIQRMIMDRDGNNSILLGYSGQMCWHPDGHLILSFYHSPIADTGTVMYIIDPDDGSVQQELEMQEKRWSPDFSPDGNYMVYVDSDDIRRPIKIIDYPGFTNSITIDTSGGFRPKWSPNGNEIVFCREDDIYIVNIDGSNRRRITQNTSEAHYYYPCWSPNGDKIIFWVTTTVNYGTLRDFLYMVNRDGTNLHKVIEDSTVQYGDWSR